MLLRACFAVSTSPPMSDYPKYVARVNAISHEGKTQPHARRLLAGLAKRSNRWPRLASSEICSVRLAAALVSFNDDYPAPHPLEYFRDEPVRRVIESMRGREALTLLELFDHPSCTTLPTFLDATLVIHAALRQLARGRDTCALPSVALSLDERLEIGAGLLPFLESGQGDPLGDGYHYVANLAAGMAAGASLARRGWLVPLFAAGPELMTGIREGVFGSRLFFGNHAPIDRMGLAHGLALARAVSGVNHLPRREGDGAALGAAPQPWTGRSRGRSIPHS